MKFLDGNDVFVSLPTCAALGICMCLSHDSTHIAESAHTGNRAIVTRPFSLAEGWGLGMRLGIKWT